MLDTTGHVPAERWKAGDLTIDVGAQRVLVADEPIVLPKLSFNFLLALVRAAPRVLTIDELMDVVWPGIFVNAETVTQRAKLLRDALKDDPRSPRYIGVSRGRGYQLIPEAIGLEDVTSLKAGGSDPRNVTIRAATLAWLGAIVLGVTVLFGSFTLIKNWKDGPAVVGSSGLRVAVLPFDNLSSDPSDSFIARSIPEMVLNRLSSVRGLTVISRDSTLLNPVSKLSATEAGERLKAAYLVEGSVQRIGDALRVTCFVIDTAKGTRLWSERFDWPMTRLYALQDRIADRVAASLETKAHGVGSLPEQADASSNSDAYLAYLKGKSLLNRFTVAETDAAAEQFERAVKLDPDFSDALTALFDARMQGADLRKDDLAPFRVRYQPLLDKALQRNPNSGPALFAKAMWSNLPASERERLFQRAAELDPSNSRGLTAYAEFLDRNALKNNGAIGEQGKPLVDRVLSVDPLSPRTRWWAVQRRWSNLPPEKIEKELARELEIDPQNYTLANRYAFRRWMFHGETAEALILMERTIATDPQNPLSPHFAAALYLDANDPAAARAIALTTPASRDSTRVVFAQYIGDWRRAGAAAYDRRGFLFNEYSNWGWPEAIRDYSLHTRQFDRGAEEIASRFGFDLKHPTVRGIAQMMAAPALAHILLVKGDEATGKLLLADSVRWIDGHPSYGLAGIMRYRAAAMMLLGDSRQALSYLRASIETGHDIRQWWYIVDRDPVWLSVHDDPRFRAIAAICRRMAREQRVKLDTLRATGKVPTRVAGASA